VNWSIGNPTQGNLLDPGSTPHENLQFLLFCAAVIRGVHSYGPLLRAVIATASNDHRLGANEAPPAIISVYLGSQLEDVFNQIKTGTLQGSAKSALMSLGVETLPDLNKDPGDRNRTSPFAFTGNRFEFRAVGSGQSVAGPLVALNTILADSLAWISDQLESKMSSGMPLEEAAFTVLKSAMEAHDSVVFGGDGYSSEWHRMAVEERGLENLPTSADALPVLKRPEIRELFERTGVLSPTELESRYEVYAEQYILAIEVETRLAVRMARTQVYPVVMDCLDKLSLSLKNQEALGIPTDRSLVTKVATLNQQLVTSCLQLEEAMEKAPHGVDAHLRYCADVLVPGMLAIREAVDGLEMLIDDASWPLPSYQEMLFLR
jgi:glutamine synthetase